MTVVVELRGQHYRVELAWDRVLTADGGTTWGWWLRSVDGQPRPRGRDVPVLYQRALKMAEQAMRADKERE